MRLLNRSTESEARTLALVGRIALLLVVVATVLYFVVKPFERDPDEVVSVGIDTPYVGQGVTVGTPVIMHGAKIGQVVSVSSAPGGGVQLETELQPGPTHGLTDAMGIDYRPSNYFGVTGLNVIPTQGGRLLQSGMQISIVPRGNFSLQALLYRLGALSTGVFDQRLISVIERATRYADGLVPLLETVLTVGNSLAKVQTVSTERLLRNVTGVSVAFPGFVDSLTYAGNNFLHSDYVDFDPEETKRTWRIYPLLDERRKAIFESHARLFESTKGTEEYWLKVMEPLFDAARVDLFGRVGYLLGSMVPALYPLLESVRTVSDAVPKIVSPDNFAYTITELRKRFERMYAGSGDQRALQVRVTLDLLPGVAAPLGAPMEGTP